MTTDANRLKTEAFEARGKAYKKTWETDLMGTAGASPGYWCYSMWCSWCASYQLRQRALYGDMNRYICCGGYLPCSGRCGESKCPSCCLCMEVVCCFPQSVASTRWMLQDEMHLQNTKCDNCIITTTIFLQYLSCICSLAAICVDGLDQAACIIDFIADCMWCTMCACMQTQHKVQMDARDANPALVQPMHPFMAPIQQNMGVPPSKAQTMGMPMGHPGQPSSYPPPSNYPPKM